MLRPSEARRAVPSRCIVAAVVLTSGLVVGGCTSTAPVVVGSEDLAEAVAVLARPLPGNLAALYNLRVARSGGLRLAVVARGDEGRLTISEPFGSAVSVTAWSPGSQSVFYDMRESCQREIGDLEEVLGVGAVPLAAAVRLLGGRLPATGDDQIEVGDAGVLTIIGTGWAATVRVVPDPWRVVEVTEFPAVDDGGWRLDLRDHTSSVPGRIRVEHPDGRWVELDLSRLEWPEGVTLPELPTLPECAEPRVQPTAG